MTQQLSLPFRVPPFRNLAVLASLNRMPNAMRILECLNPQCGVIYKAVESHCPDCGYMKASIVHGYVTEEELRG
jgi:hypothetical protein